MPKIQIGNLSSLIPCETAYQYSDTIDLLTQPPPVIRHLSNSFTLRKDLRRYRQSGMAFAITALGLFVVVCIVLVGVANGGGSNNGLTTTTVNAAQQTSVNLNVTEASYLAESGVEYTLEWLHNQSTAPTNTNAFAPAIWNSTTTGSPARSVVTFPFTDGNGVSYSGTFSVEIYPSSTNSTNTLKEYLIESIGTFNGVTQLVSAMVQLEGFGHFLYFVDKNNSSFSDPFYWVGTSNAADGPVHDNNADSSGNPGQVPDNILWFNSASTGATFTYQGSDAFSCVSPTVNWHLNSWANSTGPSSSSDWQHIATQGANGVLIGCSNIPMPTSSSSLATLALAGTSAPTGSTTTVVLPNASGTLTGGIYIHGPATRIYLSVAPTDSTSQVVQVSSLNSSTYPFTTYAWTIVVSPSKNQTILQETTLTGLGPIVIYPATTYTGLPNGIIYCDNNIGTGIDGTTDLSAPAHGASLKYGIDGTIADNYYVNGNLSHANTWTIATDFSHSINIDDSIVTNTERQKDSKGNFIAESADANFIKNAGMLGLVSKNIEIDQNDYGTVYALTNVELDCSIFATGIFDVAYYDQRQSGTLLLNGALITGSASFFDQTDTSGNVTTGLAPTLRYDSRLSNTASPGFPTTSNIYNIVSWTRQGSTKALQ